MLILPVDLRDEFKKPLGKLHKSIDLIKEPLQNQISQDKLVISIGDVTTMNLVDKEIIPQICIIDNITRREPVELNLEHTANVIYVDNPPGVITDELIDVIIDSLKEATLDNPVIIEVKGEEDLAVLPCIINAPKDALVLYGQPGEGVVLVKVKEAYSKALDYYNKLIKE